MDKQLKLSETISINAPVAKVWAAITDKALIKEYFFGTDVISDWKVGSPVIWSGEWEGKHYEEKGEVLAAEQDKKLSFTYLSSGKEDKPENYANVIYEVTPQNGSTMVTITQDNIEDEEGVEHMKKNWGMVLDGMKKLLEK